MALRRRPSRAPSASSGIPPTTIATKTRRWCGVSSSSITRRTSARMPAASACRCGSTPSRSGSRSTAQCRARPAGCAELARHLQNDEPIGPRDEAALAAELGQLREDGEHRIAGGLVCDVGELLAGDGGAAERRFTSASAIRTSWAYSSRSASTRGAPSLTDRRRSQSCSTAARATRIPSSGPAAGGAAA